MEIYVVQQGDTIENIAQKFDISPVKLSNDNQIMTDQLVIGQALVIAIPEQVYTVKDGDTLVYIAESHGVTVMQLLRNNPDLANRQYIYPGETIVISYDNDGGSTWIVGYTYPFISEGTLRMTLPYLTYLLMFNYRVTEEGELIGSDEDVNIIQIAKQYGTLSTLVLTTYSRIGEINLEVEYNVLLDVQLQDRIIEKLLNTLRAKEYSGVNLAYQNINTTNQQLYIDFLKRVTDSLHPEGFTVFLTLNPGLYYNGVEVTFEQLDLEELSRYCDGILFLSYDWGTIVRAPIQYSIVTTPSLLEYIVSQVPLDKIRIVLPTLGYDWKLPYLAGQSRANALNYDSVLALAREMGAVIQYDESTLTAYFEYTDHNDQQHIVWFKDARSIDTAVKILKSYGITGLGIWNIMYYFAQLWLVINTQYEIVKV